MYMEVCRDKLVKFLLTMYRHIKSHKVAYHPLERHSSQTNDIYLYKFNNILFIDFPAPLGLEK